MKSIAEKLLDISAVSLSPKKPFTWASGIKAPIYCDNRLTLSDVEVRREAEDALADLIRETFPTCEYIMGTATAGIGHAALVAERMGLPMGFVRSAKKDHGKNKQVEGKLIPGAKVVLIEDLFSTGGSSIAAAKALEEEGFDLLGIVSIFTYGLPACEKNFSEAGYKTASLTNFQELVDIALSRGDIGEEDVAVLDEWRQGLA